MESEMKETWEYLVKDFLDIKCTIREPEQEFLLDFLKQRGVSANKIQMHPAFSVDDHLVVVMEGENNCAQKSFVYHPNEMRIDEQATEIETEPAIV